MSPFGIDHGHISKNLPANSLKAARAARKYGTGAGDNPLHVGDLKAVKWKAAQQKPGMAGQSMMYRRKKGNMRTDIEGPGIS